MLPTDSPAISLLDRLAEGADGSTRAYEIVGIGASLGGLEALRAVLSPMPCDFPLPILVVQHVWARSCNLLPSLLGRAVRLRVKPAEAGERPRPGTIYVVPPDHHLLVADGALALSRAERENFCRPSIDVLFRSLADGFGARTIGVVLTGMGRDGARGMAAIRAGGGLGIAQDEASSVAPSMPCAAVDLGKADIVLSPERIAAALQVAAGVAL